VLLTSRASLMDSVYLPILNNSYPLTGSHIVFCRLRLDGEDIYLMGADGSDLTRLTSSAWQEHPRWSPDGAKIVYEFKEQLEHSNIDIYMINRDGSGVTRLTDAEATDSFPDWSPDGTRILFTSYRDGNAEIYVMNADGSGQTNLSKHTDSDYVVAGAWSPDGTRITFRSHRTGNDEIYVVNVDGSGLVNLSNNP
jgi:TolB protein